MDKVNKFRKWSLAMAETIDAWRIMPRIIITSYGFMVGYMTYVFMSFKNIEKIQCDPGVLKTMLDAKYSLAQAQDVACRVVDIIGPPNAYTTLLSIMVGASAAIFAFYTNSGKNWSLPIASWDLSVPPKPIPADTAKPATGDEAAKK